jgi:hypothetical protein
MQSTNIRHEFHEGKSCFPGCPAWQSTKTKQFSKLSRVEIIGLDIFGTICNIRVDSNFERIYTIKLDNPSDTPDGEGFFVARSQEIRILPSL